MERIGLIWIGEFSIKKYILDVIFIKQATGYGWFMQYIIICYIIFFVVKKVMGWLVFIKNYEMATVMMVFIAWFVMDSLLFINTDIPFLKARQMLCFPTGMIITKYKEPIKPKMKGRSGKLLELAAGFHTNFLNGYYASWRC